MEPNAYITPNRFASLTTFTGMLDAVVKAGHFTNYTTLVVAAWRAWDRTPTLGNDYKLTPVYSCQMAMSTFLGRLSKSVILGIHLPDERREAIERDLITIFDTYTNNVDRSPSSFYGIEDDDQQRFAQAFKERLESHAATLLEMIEMHRKSASAPTTSNSQLREPGHPYFNTDKDPVFFLSGTKKNPVVHIDPECGIYTKYLEGRKLKGALPVGPLSEDALDFEFGNKESTKCCPGCKTPKWGERNYADVRMRFFFREGKSVYLPEQFNTTS